MEGAISPIAANRAEVAFIIYLSLIDGDAVHQLGAWLVALNRKDRGRWRLVIILQMVHAREPAIVLLCTLSEEVVSETSEFSKLGHRTISCMLPLGIFSKNYSSWILTTDQRANISQREKLRTHPKIFSIDTSNNW